MAPERRGRDVSRQKGDAVETHRPSVLNKARNLAEVEPVNRGAPHHFDVGRDAAQAGDASFDQRERVHSPYGAVQRFTRSVERDDDPGKAARHLRGQQLQMQAARMEMQREAPRAKQIGDLEHIGAQKGLAS